MDCQCLTLATILAVSAAAGAAPVDRAAEKKPVKIEFRCAELAPADGLIEAIEPRTNRRIYLHKNSDLSEKDIVDIKVKKQDTIPHTVIEFTFAKESRKKVEEMSEKQLNKPIALLIDGEIVVAPIIRAKLSTKAAMTGDIAEEVLGKLAGFAPKK